MENSRISWDGIKDVDLKENIITGLAYDPTDSNLEWKPFKVDVEKRKVEGGSYIS